MNSKKAGLASLVILTAIVLGAFGAHALKEVLSPGKLVSFETGVRYQVYMGLALLILALNEDKFQFKLKWVWILLLTGMHLFSGSIYFLVLQEPLNVSLKFLGPITPLGGLLMIIGWAVLAINLFFPKKK